MNKIFQSTERVEILQDEKSTDGSPVIVFAHLTDSEESIETKAK